MRVSLAAWKDARGREQGGKEKRRFRHLEGGRISRAAVSSLVASPGHPGRRAVLGHTHNTLTRTRADDLRKGPCVIFVVP